MADNVCSWIQVDAESDNWETTCGHVFVINEGTPEENSMVYCCYCSNVIDQVVWEEDDEEEDEDGED